MKNPAFDGKDRFMYNYHVFVKMKYEDKWKQKVKNAPVKYFEEQHANAWDDKTLNAKIRSWNRSEKGFTCTRNWIPVIIYHHYHYLTILTILNIIKLYILFIYT